MSTLRRGRDFVKQFDVPLYFVTALLGLFLTVGAIFLTAKVPSEHDWSPGEPLFWALVVSAVFVPVYTLYKSLDAYFETQDKRRSEVERDLTIACQKVVSRIVDACPRVGVNDLASCVWLCREDDSFDEIARFYLPHHRKGSGVIWGRGRGVAGTAWARGEDLDSDVTVLVARLDELGKAAFDKLPPAERFGLTASDLDKTRDRTGVCAIRLVTTGAKPKLVGMFVLEYSGASDFQCVSQEVFKRGVSELLAGCEDVLTRAAGAL
jgi:hypothetical protein